MLDFASLRRATVTTVTTVAAFALGLAACRNTDGARHPAAAPRSPAAAIGDALAAAIDAGDLPGALAALCRGYAELADAPCSPALRLALLDPADVMSHVDVARSRLSLQPMVAPGGGDAYWDRWSAILADGHWDWRARLVGGEPVARRVANTLVASVLAHELAHHLAALRACRGDTPAREELRADELAMPLLGALAAASGAFDQRYAHMRWLADEMVAAVPGRAPALPRGYDVRSWIAADAHALPAAPRDYAALHLEREARLVGEEPDARAAMRARCLDPYDRFRGARAIDAHAGTVVTLARLAIDPALATFALDRDARVYAARGDAIVALPGGAVLGRADFAYALAAFDAGRVAVSDGTTVHLLGDAAAPPQPGDHLAFARDGALWTGTGAGGLARGDARTPPLAPPTAAWGDGPEPSGAVTLPALADGDALVFWDANDHAIRRATAGGAATLAGGGVRYGDAPAADAMLDQVVALAILRDGRVAFAELVDGGRTLAVRAIEP